MLTILASGIVAPGLYELRQIYVLRLEYFKNFDTLSRLIYIIVSIVNIEMQESPGSNHWTSKLCMILILVL